MSKFFECFDKAIFLAAMLGIFILVILLLIMFVGLLTEKCIQSSMVISIGGCNQYTCGVRLANGDHRHMYGPVLGQEVCTKIKDIFNMRDTQ